MNEIFGERYQVPMFLFFFFLRKSLRICSLTTTVYWSIEISLLNFQNISEHIWFTVVLYVCVSRCVCMDLCFLMIKMTSFSSSYICQTLLGILGGSVVKYLLSQVRKTPGVRKWRPTPVFLPEKSHGQRSLEGYSP